MINIDLTRNDPKIPSLTQYSVPVQATITFESTGGVTVPGALEHAQDAFMLISAPEVLTTYMLPAMPNTLPFAEDSRYALG